MSGAIADDRATDIGAGEIFYIGVELFEAWSHPRAGNGDLRNGIPETILHGDPGDARAVGVKGVEAELIGYEQSNKDATDQADGEAENIDERKSLFPDEVAKS